VGDDPQTVAVLGAGGTMGRGMSANIARAGLTVRAWNRSREKAEPLAELGADVCDEPGRAAAGADVVITILSDADAVLDVARAALGEQAPGAIWLQMSTIGIEGTQACAELAAQRGLTFVDAPVLGTKQPAEKGELVVLASGPDAVRGRLAPVLDAVGQRTLWAGDAGQASRLKLVTNAWIAAVVEGAAESLALAQGLGVDPALFLEAVSGGPLDLPYLQLKGTAMLQGEFAPSFRLALAAKDTRLVRAAADGAGLDLPLIAAVAERFATAAAEHGDKDISAVFLASVPGR